MNVGASLSSLATPEAMHHRLSFDCEQMFAAQDTPVLVPNRATDTHHSQNFEPGLIAKPGEAPLRLFWFGKLSRHEDYMLTRFRKTLKGILKYGYWELSQPRLIVGGHDGWLER